MASKPYMPLMMGDWIRGTQGMRAEVKGVYIGLLIHQYDHGFLPADLETLALIEPEVAKVWVILKCKFEEFETGKLRNKKLELVRDFWNKQGKNGKKGGRPKKENPNETQPITQSETQTVTINNDLDYDIESNLKYALDEIYIDGIRAKWKHIDFDFEVSAFKEKVRGSPEHYKDHETAGIRLALQHQLRNAKKNDRGNFKKTAGRSVTNFAGSGYNEPL